VSLPEAEKRRNRRGSASSGDGDRPVDDGRRLGIVLITVLGLVSGLSDLAGGFALAVDRLALFGVPLAALGALKSWAAVGLYRLEARALGFTLLFFGVGATLSAGELVFAFGAGNDLLAPTGALALDIGIVGYLLVVADAFE